MLIENYVTPQVLAGASLDSKAGAKDSVVPGLQLVKLPKETLDGFITLVFPLLLRRRDIGVFIFTRERKTTIYDVRVQIQSASQSPPPAQQQPPPPQQRTRSADGPARDKTEPAPRNAASMDMGPVTNTSQREFDEVGGEST